MLIFFLYFAQKSLENTLKVSRTRLKEIYSPNYIIFRNWSKSPKLHPKASSLDHGFDLFWTILEMLISFLYFA